MSGPGKKKGKKKWTPVALDTVLPNAVVRATTSWAEEVESELQLSESALKKISNLNLPTAPRAACDLVIDETRIPPNGPFLAYLKNLPYEITDDEIIQQFKELKVQSVQLPKDDRQDRMRGYGYVEFKDKSNLIAALQQGELTLRGRNVVVELPADEEQKQERGSRSGGMSFGRSRDSDRMDRSDKPLGEWRAGAPVPHDPEKSTATKHSGVGFTRPQNRDREGGSSGPFREFRRDFQPADSGPSFSRGGGAFRERDDRDGGRSSERGGNRPFKRFEPRETQRSAFGKKFDRDDREMKRDPEREEPKQRPKVEVLPRSIPTDDSSRAPQALPASIFGAAKPVDTTKREMEIEAKLHMMNTNPVRGSSPRLTPTSNLSRASSVSSLSNFRKRDGDASETANDSNRFSGAVMNENSEINEGDSAVKMAAPENVWMQRAAVKTVTTLPPANDDSENVSSSVIEENSEAVEEDSSSPAIYVPPQPGNRTTATVQENADADGGGGGGGGGGTSTSSTSGGDERSSARYSAPRPDTDRNDQKNWITYGQDSFSSSQHSLGEGHGGGGGRYGGGRGSRYNDNNKFGSNISRDNRRERRGDGGERRPDRYFQKRGSDDNFRESSSFPSKWSHSNRDGGNGGGGGGGGGNSYRNRSSDYGDGRRQYRDNGGGFSNYRDGKNENRSNAYRSFGSSNHHPRSQEGGGGGSAEFHGHGGGRVEERRPYNERLTEGEEKAQQHQPSTVDSRLNESPVEHDISSLENGQQENGLMDDEEGVRESSDNPAADGENDSAFKTRKKNKKKKNNTTADGDETTSSKRDPRSSDVDKKPRNQKEERKNPEVNHINNDKTPSKNHVKTKEIKSEKSLKKIREPREEMPKQKEEKAPNFQDTNRFQFLNSED